MRRFSVHRLSQFVVVAAYQTVFNFFGKLDVGVLFVKVVVKSVIFVLGTAVKVSST